jgi:Protein of unknown function (DUF2528)
MAAVRRAAEIHAVTLRHDAMNTDHTAEPRMMRIENFPELGPVGVLKPCCILSVNNTKPGRDMNKKRYMVSYNHNFDMVVEIDHAVMTDELLHSIDDFWSDAECRLDAESGDITKTVLKFLAAEAFRLTISTWDAIRVFDWNSGGGQEGWPSMDGSAGIKIVSIDQVTFDADDLSVHEID